MSIDASILKRKFSVGLSLGESIEDIKSFLEGYSDWLNSMYFSAPFGRKFYSRGKLKDEYDGNEQKLVEVLKIVREYGIRLELTLNTRDLTDAELNQAVKFCNENDVIPEEIVCMKEYAAYIKNVYPECELKYSFNNHDTWMKRLTDEFDTIIIGKALLRDIDKINTLAEKYNITYMLNNGCSFECGGNCGNDNCHRIFDVDVKKNGINYAYARSTIFPSELKVLLMENPNAKNYKFKISNRPWGLDYTKKALDSYIGLEDPIEELKKDHTFFRIFCPTRPMSEHTSELDIEKIMEFKKGMGLYL